MPATSIRRYSPLPLLIVGGGICLQAMFLQSVLGDRTLATQWFSPETWQATVEVLGGQVDGETGEVRHHASYPGLLLLLASVTVVLLPLGAVAIRRAIPWYRWRLLQRHPLETGLKAAAITWARSGWAWWWLPGGWELVRVLSVLAEWAVIEELMIRTVSLVEALALAGWLAALLANAWPLDSTILPDSDSSLPRRTWRRTWLLALAAVAAYTLIATAINWARYHNLLVPHGDSAMYEEHLWNTWHGKGFRSYLDDGRLFLGEHPQVVHLLLSPLYWFWSSHLLLELCESAALAIGALAVLRMTRRETGSDHLALALAIAYLLAFPVHFLDIAIDGKTFRPINLGVPLLLWAIERWESGNRRSAFVLLLLTLTAKEDYCLVIAPLGAWWAWTRTRSADRVRGILIAVGTTAWLLLVLLLVIPAFRGDEPHYAQYFGELGGTPAEILQTAVAQPGLLLSKWFSPRSAFYALALLLPVGFLPLMARGRLAVGLPIFAMLCLLEFSTGQASGQAVVPFHHFHAPLIPVLYWAAASGLGELARRRPQTETLGKAATRGAYLALAAAACSGLFFSAGPLGIAFWDPHSEHHGGTLLTTSRRATMFEQVQQLVPTSARVFSTDFVHPRFTHHARSYDYSDYKRASDVELTHPEPGQDYYIVIDTQHPYSKLTAIDEVHELKAYPQDWDIHGLVSDDDGTLYYIVLKRKPAP